MPSLTLREVEGSGGSLNTGDVIRTYATELPSGKALLPLDNSILDTTTYPVLGALMPNTAILGHRYLLNTTNLATATTLDCSADGSFFVFSHYDDGEIFNCIDPNNGTGSSNVLFNNSATEGTFDLCVSATGNKAYALQYDTTGTDFELIRWDGSSGLIRVMSDIIPNAGSIPQNSLRDVAVIKCSPDGQDVLFIDSTQTGSTPITYWTSNDFGATWSEGYTDPTVYSSKTYPIITVSEDLGSFLIVNASSPSSSAAPSFVVRNGTKTELTLPVGNNIASTMSPSTNRLFYAGMYQSNIQGVYFNMYHTDDDSTWVKHSFDLQRIKNTPEEPLNLTSGESSPQTKYEVSNIVASTISEDIVYCVIWTKPTSGNIQEYLMSFNVETKEVVMLGKRIQQAASLSGSSFINLRIKKGDTGNNEWLLTTTTDQSSTLSKDEVIVGKILKDPEDEFNIKNPQSVPYRVVAE
jgi:hypothetical protein